MPINKNALMNLASKFLGQEKMQALNKAYDMANSIVGSSSSPQEALKRANVNSDTIKKLQGMLSVPGASYFLKPLGLDVAETKAMLDQLKLGTPNPSAGTQTDSELQSLQNTLNRLK